MRAFQRVNVVESWNSPQCNAFFSWWFFGGPQFRFLFWKPFTFLAHTCEHIFVTTSSPLPSMHILLHQSLLIKATFSVSMLESFLETRFWLTLWTLTGFGMRKACTEEVHFCRTLNTNVMNYRFGLGMCKACSKGAHYVARSTRRLSQVRACVKYEPRLDIPQHVEHAQV